MAGMAAIAPSMPFPGEIRPNVASSGPATAAVAPRPRQQRRRAPVGHHPDPLGRHQPCVHDHPPRRLGEHADERRQVAERSQRLAPDRARRGEDGVERHDERPAQLRREGQHVRSVLAAEDAVLVLDHHDVGAAALQCARGSRVVATFLLADTGRPPRPPGPASPSRTIAATSTADTPRVQQRVTQVARERADAAGTRWVGRDDADPQRRCVGRPRALERRRSFDRRRHEDGFGRLGTDGLDMLVSLGLRLGRAARSRRPG